VLPAPHRRPRRCVGRAVILTPRVTAALPYHVDGAADADEEDGQPVQSACADGPNVQRARVRLVQPRVDRDVAPPARVCGHGIEERGVQGADRLLQVGSLCARPQPDPGTQPLGRGADGGVDPQGDPVPVGRRLQRLGDRRLPRARGAVQDDDLTGRTRVSRRSRGRTCRWRTARPPADRSGAACPGPAS